MNTYNTNIPKNGDTFRERCRERKGEREDVSIQPT